MPVEDPEATRRCPVAAPSLRIIHRCRRVSAASAFRLTSHSPRRNPHVHTCMHTCLHITAPVSWVSLAVCPASAHPSIVAFACGKYLLLLSRYLSCMHPPPTPVLAQPVSSLGHQPRPPRPWGPVAQPTAGDALKAHVAGWCRCCSGAVLPAQATHWQGAPPPTTARFRSQ